jgi:hypothetical protein
MSQAGRRPRGLRRASAANQRHMTAPTAIALASALRLRVLLHRSAAVPLRMPCSCCL